MKTWPVLVVIAVVALFLGAAGSLIAARSTASPPCAAGNKGEAFLDTSTSPPLLKYCDGATVKSFSGALGSRELNALTYLPSQFLGNRYRRLCSFVAQLPMTTGAVSACEYNEQGTVSVDSTTNPLMPYWKVSTTGVLGNTAYTGLNQGSASPALLPDVTWYFRLGSVANVHYYFEVGGVSAIGTAHAATVPTSTAGTNSLNQTWLMVDDGTGPNWYCCSSDATTYQCTDMGVAAQTGIDYIGIVSYANFPTSMSCTIRPVGANVAAATTVNVSAYIPVWNTSGTVTAEIVTQTGSAKYLLLNSYTVWDNG